MTVIIPTIMSGGSGSRLWPLSTPETPKQLLPLVTDRTMLQETALRLSGEIADPATGASARFAAPLVVANARHGEIIVRQLDAIGLPPIAVALEADGRNTAPAAAVAALLAIEAGGPHALVLLAPSDHHIADPDTFRAVVARAAPQAAAGKIVVFGIEPTGPETGYGYIRAGEPLDGGTRAVGAFAEKPARTVAEGFLAEGGWYWNAGLFLFRADVVLAELERLAPELLDSVRAAVTLGARRDRLILLEPTAFAACPDAPFDKVVMEKTALGAVAPLSCGWNDIGAWPALHDVTAADDQRVTALGPVLTVGCTNVYARSEGPQVAVIGLSDVVVIATGGRVLVVHKAHAQNVKAAATHFAG